MSTNFAIVIDSTSDLPPSIANELDMTVVPYIYTLDGKEYLNYLDYREQPIKIFYDTLRAGKTASTTQVTTHRYREIWDPILQAGTDILYICLSSGLSKSYDQSVMAAREAAEDFPGRKIVTIDSKSASLGQGLLSYYAGKARQDGKNLDETAAYLEGIVPMMQIWVMADDLNHLRRGGRVSGASAFVGTMLSIKPVLTITDEGKLVPVSKQRGRSKAIDYIVGRMSELNMNPKDQTIFIAHSDALEMAEQMKAMIVERHGIKDIVINDIGPVIGAHTGPGSLAMVFLGDKRHTVS